MKLWQKLKNSMVMQKPLVLTFPTQLKLNKHLPKSLKSPVVLMSSSIMQEFLSMDSFFVTKMKTGKNLNVNLTSVYACTKSALKSMMKRKNNGRIISMTSVVGQMGNAGQSVYAATKAGIIGFTKSIAKEVASRNITVNAIAPGFVKTEMTDALTPEQQAKIMEQIPLKRVADPAEIASVVKF
jgi:NAD(P)-dependent dehydrogenase (short-subunit alcohol dehydrogenase family)